MSAKTIIVTRPSAQARQLIDTFHAKLNHSPACQILSLPLLTIAPKEGADLTTRIFTALQDADLTVFVSPNAIECTTRLIEGSWQGVSKAIIPIGVMGGSSRLALHLRGIGLESLPTPILIPQENERWDAEGLWAELQSLGWSWSGRKVVIFKGEGGRDWLADTLTAAGAQVEAIPVYARIPLDLSSPAWSAIQKVDLSQSLWLLTSSEAVRYLGKVVGSQIGCTLADATALCPHRNIAESAKAIGFGVVLACEPGDDALISASQEWLAQ